MPEFEINRSENSAEERRWWPDVTAASLGAVIAIIFIVAITIAAELSESLKDGLADMTGHHWISKGLLSLGVFLLTTIVSHPVLSRRHPKDLTVWGIAVAGTALLGAMVVLFFFVGHFLGE